MNLVQFFPVIDANRRCRFSADRLDLNRLRMREPVHEHKLFLRGFLLFPFTALAEGSAVTISASD